MKILTKTFITISLGVLTQVSLAQVAVVVGAKSAAANMSANDVSALFLGKSDQLPGVGVALLLDQAESNAVRDTFYSKVTGKSAAQVKAAWSRLVFSGKATPPKEVANSAEVKKLVATNANAIGYIEKSAVDATVKVLLSVD
jgi:ABC-type phosphate transport system substrate-binding protein